MALSESEKQELAELRKLNPTSTYKEPTFGEKAGSLAYGAATGLAGGLGELEEFGAYTVPEYLGLQEEGKRDNVFGTGRATIFPTVKEAQQVLGKIGIQKPREEVSGYQTAGEILGGFGTSLPGILKGGAKMLVGVTSKTGEKLAQAAEKLGFKLSPAQVRADAPIGQKGATFFAEKNQTLANELASKGTGKQIKEIDRPFIGERFTDLGGKFDKLYQGKVFNIDKDAVDALNQIRAMEAQLPGVASVSPVAQTAEEILRNFNNLANRTGAVPNTFGIEGEALQRIRNALTQRARSTTSGNAREIYNLVDVIDASIAKNHPKIAKELDVLRPQYRNTIILEDLYKNGGLKQGNISLERLGTMLRGERNVVRGSQANIDELGELGRELGIRARWETAGAKQAEGTEVLGKALGTGVSDVLGGVASTAGLRSRPARAVQRFYSTPATTTAGKIMKGPTPSGATGTSLGTAARPLQGEEQ
jgi:hypothetical protein